MSHYLEHMLFMGSERFPDENDYDSYLQRHGGSANAFTEMVRRGLHSLPCSHLPCQHTKVLAPLPNALNLLLSSSQCRQCASAVMHADGLATCAASACVCARIKVQRELGMRTAAFVETQQSQTAEKHQEPTSTGNPVPFPCE